MAHLRGEETIAVGLLIQTSLPLGTLLGALATLFGALIALVGVFIVQRRTDAREERNRAHQRTLDEQRRADERARNDQRLAHERGLEELRLENERQSWLRAERRQIYSRLVALTNFVDPTQPWEFTDLTGELSEIELVTDSAAVRAAAEDVVSHYSKVRRTARELHKSGQDPAQDEDWIKSYDAAIQHRQHFVELARADLGGEPVA